MSPPRPTAGTTIGRITGLWRYPVKSMAGEPLDEVEVSWHGLVGDRRWAFVRDGVPSSGFPWFTLRQRADLGFFRPSFTRPDEPDRSPTTVRTPSGEVFDVTDPALAAELCAEGVRVIRQDRGVFDTFPLSLITGSTIAALGESVDLELDVRRFRPNFLVEAVDGGPFPEDDWVGAVLRIGDALMRVDKRDGRCKVITIDPETTESQPSILRAVAREREGCLGVYGSTVEPGIVRRGDPVILVSRARAARERNRSAAPDRTSPRPPSRSR